MPPAPTTEDYTVIKGDTFASIAKKSGTTVKAIVEANPSVDAKKLKIGQKLHLPTASTPSASAPAMAPAAAEANSGGEQTYKVKSGDTLTSIAKHFHVSIKSIQSANSLGTTSIKVGQALKIPASATPPPAPAPAPVEPTPPPAAPAPMSSPAPLSPTPPPAH